MSATSDPSRIEIEALSLSLTPEVGADDSLVAVRVVPDGREGLVVFGRSLRSGERDDGRKIIINRTIGETLLFRPGSIHVAFGDVDHAHAETDGYWPAADAIWRWLSIGNPASPEVFRYLLATARRLDGAHALLVEVQKSMADLSGNFGDVRTRLIRALSLAEIMVVAVGRVIDLLDGLHGGLGISIPLPASIEAKKATVRVIRNAFEHIEDRALGQVNKRPHPDALSIFEQARFVREGILSYAGKTIGLRDELPALLVAARRHIYDVAVSVAGEARTINQPIHMFHDGTP